ncbi:MAG: ATP-binding protein [Actinomycetota bacterium]|nr:ATP-binding protein [Actinomycetota bacterium]
MRAEPGKTGHSIRRTNGREVGARPLADELERSIEVPTEHVSFETVLQQMPAAVVIAEPTGALRLGNAMVEEILGIPFAELAERWLRDAVVGFHVDGRRYRREEWPLVRAVTRGETVTGEEIEIARDDGSRVLIEATAAPVRDPRGVITAGVLSFHDVTERRRAEMRARLLAQLGEQLASPNGAVSALERLPRLLVPAVADWCATDGIDETGRVRSLGVAYADPALARHEAFRRSGPLRHDHPFRRIMQTQRPELYADVDDELLVRLARSPEQLEFLREIALRSWIGVPLVARGRVLGAIALATVQSARRLGEDELHLVEELALAAALALDNARLLNRLETDRDRLLQLLERLEQGVISVDRSLAVRFSNRAARTLLHDELAAGAPLPEPFDDVRLSDVAAALFGRDAAPRHWEVRLGERAYTLAGIPAAHSPRATIVVTDVSERERRERAERDFVTNAAHELQTPLTAIVSAAEVLDAGAKDVPVERDRFLAHIRRESNRLAHLTHALLLLARVQTHGLMPEQDVVEVRALLERIAGALQPADGVEIEVDCDHDLVLHGNGDLIEQAVTNLGGNAAKFTPRGSIALRGRRDGDSIVLEVSDTGPGISPSQHERIFDRFYRGDPGGVTGFGLGLAIVRESVRALGGVVELESSPGAGTTGRIVVPQGERPE